jgi:CTP synthase
MLSQVDGIIVPGGFGESGIEGKIKAIQYAREHKIPYFGLCYGMQLMVIEYARNVLKLKDAHTTEIKKRRRPDRRRDAGAEEAPRRQQIRRHDAPRHLPGLPQEGHDRARAYKKEIVEERHRHRYEINPRM